MQTTELSLGLVLLVQALESYTGRLAPRLALLSRERVEQSVVLRVLRWAGLGGGGGGGGEAGLGALLAEDAAEVRLDACLGSQGASQERTLGCIGVMSEGKCQAASGVRADQEGWPLPGACVQEERVLAQLTSAMHADLAAAAAAGAAPPAVPRPDAPAAGEVPGVAAGG